MLGCGEGWEEGSRRARGKMVTPWFFGKAAPLPGSDLLHWLQVRVLRLPDKCELRLLAHLLEVVGPQGQCLGVHIPASQVLSSGHHLLTFDPATLPPTPLLEVAPCLCLPPTGLELPQVLNVRGSGT